MIPLPHRAVRVQHPDSGTWRDATQIGVTRAGVPVLVFTSRTKGRRWESKPRALKPRERIDLPPQPMELP